MEIFPLRMPSKTQNNWALEGKRENERKKSISEGTEGRKRRGVEDLRVLCKGRDLCEKYFV